MRVYSTVLAEHNTGSVSTTELHQVIQRQPASPDITSSQGAEGGT
jgi:hypothetical protein